MTYEQEEYLRKLRAYFKQQKEDLKKYLQSENDQFLLQTHSEAIANCSEEVLKLNEQRREQVNKYHKDFEKFPQVLAQGVRGTNRLFNSHLRIKEKLANFHYQDCVDRGLNVKKVDLSEFMVAEDDGLLVSQ